MMIDSIEIKNVDTSISSRGGRVLDVRISSSNSFNTPIRPVTSVELSSKSFLGYRGELKSPIAALPLNINGETFEKFKRNNGTVIKLRQELESVATNTAFSINFPILQIPDLSASDTLYEKIAFDMQKNTMGLDYFSMPMYNCSATDFEIKTRDWCNSLVDQYGIGCVPQLRMEESLELFERKLKTLISMSESGLVDIVNVRYASIENNPHQYAKLWEHRDDLKALINCSEVPKKGDPIFMKSVFEDIETQLIQYGIDSISRRKGRASPKFIAMRNFMDPPKSISDVDEFYYAVHRASATMSKEIWQSTNHEEYCTCPVCKEKSKSEIIETYAYKDNGEIEPSGLKYFSVLHDQQSDVMELDNIRGYINSEDMKTYEKTIKTNRDDLLNSIGPRPMT